MSAPCPTRSHSIKCVFSGSTQESASFVPRDRFFSERMEESPQIITLNYILIAADFPAQLRIFTLQFCRTELAVDRLRMIWARTRSEYVNTSKWFIGLGYTPGK